MSVGDSSNGHSRGTRSRDLLAHIAPVVLWIGVVFLLSSSFGSSSGTSRFIRPLLEWLFPAASPTTIDLYHLYVRKAAHFTEYAILGMLAYRMFMRTGFARSVIRRAFTSLILVAAVAMLDEFNQSFNPLRTSSPYDVMIDLIGGVFGVIVMWILTKRRQKT